MALKMKPNKPNPDPNAYVWLLYGREGIGKTVTLASWPELYILACEPGAKGLSWYGREINDWNSFKREVSELEKNPGEFKTVGIDTIDIAYQYCLKNVCERLRIPYPGQSESGKEDFGKSWNQVYSEFSETINRITHTGRGLVYISHFREYDLVNKLGAKFTRVITSLPGQARRMLEAQVDIALYAEYFRDANQNIHRAWVTQGDDMVWAKTREIPAGEFPLLLPLKQKDGAQVLFNAFHGNEPGLDPTTLLPTKDTSKSAANVVGKYQTKAKQNPAAVKKPAAKKPAAKKAAVRKN